ncbi:MAG TPA: hypothetical protein VGF77_08500 [Allosphingosinicella sp.]|jgi:hypothetical protein
MSDLLRRQAALAKTEARYRGRALDFREVDCLRMLRAHLVAMGHKGLAPLPRYATPEGALRALRRTGHETLESLLDTLLPRIAPAAMLPGDVALMEAAGALEAVTLCVGHKVWGWHADNGLAEPVFIVPKQIKAAYRA